MDLSRIPEPARSQLQAQLDALPAAVRARLEAQLEKLPVAQLEQVLAKNAPLFQRLAAKAGNSASASASAGGKSVNTHSSTVGGSGSGLAPTRIRVYDPHDHYNQTIMRGDRPMPAGVVLLFLAIVGVVLLWSIGAFN